jgi:RimJ/RimL family protein N-acetyltransferase
MTTTLSMRITTERLDLSPIADEDVDAIAVLHSDPRVVALLVDGIPDTPVKARLMLYWNVKLAAKGYGTFAVRRRGESGLIGLFSLTPFQDDEALLELGGKLLPEAWRGSLAIEAGAAMIEHAFSTLGRDRLVSAYHPDHRAVPFALGRLGFRPAGETEMFGREVALMALDLADWKAQGARPRTARSMIARSRSDYGEVRSGQPYSAQA